LLSIFSTGISVGSSVIASVGASVVISSISLIELSSILLSALSVLFSSFSAAVVSAMLDESEIELDAGFSFLFTFFSHAVTETK
jgi:hypothetical protein